MVNLKIVFKRSFALAAILICTLQFSIAQTNIEGVITDADTGEPLIGATVVILGSENVGTVSDFDGKYVLEVPVEATTLLFSYVGYTSLEVAISSGLFDVALFSGQTLDKIVVVGYGTQRTREVTSAITSVTAEEFNKGNIQDPAQLLQGKVPGLSIAKPGGDPNGTFQIRLRGLSTFGENTSPLIVVDGIPGVDLQTIDPQDIESMDVLKDGSASAIYGTRGASGVVLITTKSGKSELNKVRYNTYVAVESPSNLPNVLSAEEYRGFSNTTDFGSETNWFEELTRNAVSHTHNLSMASGTEKSNYRLSFNYRKGEGVAITTGFDQLNGRLNFNQKALNDKLVISSVISATVRNEAINYKVPFRFAYRYNPTAPVRSDDPDSEDWGGYFQKDAFGFFNPVAIFEQTKFEGKKKKLLSSIKGEYEILKNWKISVLYSQEKISELFGYYIRKDSYWSPFGAKNGKGAAGLFTVEKLNTLLDAVSTYEFDVDKLNVKLLGGYSYQEFDDEGFGANAQDFLTDGFSYHNLSSAASTTAGESEVWSWKNKSKLIAFFGRANFNFDDTYFLSASLRKEGSTKFGENNKWGYFPGISAGTNIAKFIDIPNVDQLKVRAGYGITGNTPAQTNLSLYRFGPVGGQFFDKGKYVQAYGPVSNPNPDLKWETKSDYNIGFDLNMFDYFMTFSADYYVTETKDLILDFPVRVPPNLYETSFLNLGEMSNSGLEMALSFSKVKLGNVNWYPSLTYTKFFETILNKISGEQVESEGFRRLGDLGAPFLTGVTVAKIEEGKPIGQIVGPVYEGLDEDGNLTFKDVNGDGKFKANEDVEVLGNGLPDMQFGFSNTFSYKNWDLNFFIRSVIGHDLVNVVNARYGVPTTIAIQNGTKQALEFADATNGPVFSSVHVEDASFVKLDNLSIGYTINRPEKNFSKIRIYFAGQNLATFTNYSGIDPEVRFIDDPDGDGRGNPLAPGIDREDTYVSIRGFTFGLNITL